jgi:hypothetical protein
MVAAADMRAARGLYPAAVMEAAATAAAVMAAAIAAAAVTVAAVVVTVAAAVVITTSEMGPSSARRLPRGLWHLKVHQGALGAETRTLLGTEWNCPNAVFSGLDLVRKIFL